MSFRKGLGLFVLLAALLAFGGLGAGVQGAQAASVLDHGAVTATAPVPDQTCCMFNNSNNFNRFPFFSFQRFFPFNNFSNFNRFNFFPFFHPFTSFFPFFHPFFSRSANCFQIMTMPGGNTVTIRVC
jgi:hypothetical protein